MADFITQQLLCCVALWVTCDAFSRQPHIIVILADDLGWDDVSFHGSDQIPTPNIDELAYSGVLLHNYYVQPICTPTRSALMTGRHPIHTGLQHSVIVAPQPYGLRPNETTMAEYLKPLGYSTHMVGKWHLGFFAKEYTPTYRGFDSFYGYYCGHEDYWDHTVHWGKYWGFDLHKNMDVDWPTFGEYSTELFTTHAEKIISNHPSDKPLFLYLAHQAVHSGNEKSPLQAPYKYTSRFPYIQDERRRTFAAMVSALDDSVGNVTRTLKETGLYDNSVIIFSTDNGGPPAGFDMNYASNWPLRGTKATLWEGGIRGDGFVHSPLLEKASRISLDLVHVCDWMPTVYYLAGGNMSALPSNLDGFNVWDTLSRGEPSPRTEILHNIDPIQNTAALRVGEYKIIIGEAYGNKWNGWYKPEEYSRLEKKNFTVLHNPRADVVQCGEKPANASTNCKPTKNPCLYNVINDPCEYHNIADKYPDIVAMLLKRLDEYNATAVHPQFPPEDPKSDPKLHGYAWVPWINLTQGNDYNQAAWVN